MLSKCANPECSARFLYLHDGKVFRVEPQALHKAPAGTPAAHNVVIAAKPGQRPEYFWLCSNCADRLTLGANANGVVLVPAFRSAMAAKAAAGAQAA